MLRGYMCYPTQVVILNTNRRCAIAGGLHTEHQQKLRCYIHNPTVSLVCKRLRGMFDVPAVYGMTLKAGAAVCPVARALWWAEGSIKGCVRRLRIRSFGSSISEGSRVGKGGGGREQERGKGGSRSRRKREG